MSFPRILGLTHSFVNVLESDSYTPNVVIVARAVYPDPDINIPWIRIQKINRNKFFTVHFSKY